MISGQSSSHVPVAYFNFDDDTNLNLQNGAHIIQNGGKVITCIQGICLGACKLQDPLDHCPMPINTDQNYDIDIRADQFLSIILN